MCRKSFFYLSKICSFKKLVNKNVNTKIQGSWNILILHDIESLNEIPLIQNLYKVFGKDTRIEQLDNTESFYNMDYEIINSHDLILIDENINEIHPSTIFDRFIICVKRRIITPYVWRSDFNEMILLKFLN